MMLLADNAQLSGCSENPHHSAADVLFSEPRDMAAAQAFFHSAQAVTGITPDRVSICSEP